MKFRDEGWMIEDHGWYEDEIRNYHIVDIKTLKTIAESIKDFENAQLISYTPDMQKYIIKKAQEGDEEAKLLVKQFTYVDRDKSERDFVTILREFETEMRYKLHELSFKLVGDAYNLGWQDGRKEDS